MYLWTMAGRILCMGKQTAGYIMTIALHGNWVSIWARSDPQTL